MSTAAERRITVVALALSIAACASSRERYPNPDASESQDASADARAICERRCDGPGAVLDCEAGGAQPCPPATPECDARLGACVMAGAACGDGVVHDSEQCDDGNDVASDRCDACRDVPCVSSSDCSSDRPWCSELRGGEFYCRDGNIGGAPLSARCATDADCETGWCDSEQLRCNAACESWRECGVGDAVCDAFAPRSCLFQCSRTQECGPGRACRADINREDERIITEMHCSDRSAPDPLLDGDYRCQHHTHCITGACGYSSGGCSVLCETDADCADPSRPYCVEGTPSYDPDLPERLWPRRGRRVKVCGDGPPRWDYNCVDEDGDGAASAFCGGTDCSDFQVVDGTVIGCSDATHVDVCRSGVRVSEQCGGASPFCRYPEGTCVAAAAACGDRVVHAGEECDDGNSTRGDGCHECQRD